MNSDSFVEAGGIEEVGDIEKVDNFEEAGSFEEVDNFEEVVYIEADNFEEAVYIEVDNFEEADNSVEEDSIEDILLAVYLIEVFGRNVLNRVDCFDMVDSAAGISSY